MTEQTYETDTFNRYIPLSEAAAVFQLLNELHDQINSIVFSWRYLFVYINLILLNIKVAIKMIFCNQI